MTIDLVVNDRKEDRKGEVVVTLLPADEMKQYEGYWILKSALHPDVSELKIGQRLRVRIDEIDEPVRGVVFPIEAPALPAETLL